MSEKLSRFIVQLARFGGPVETLSDTGDVSVKEYPCIKNGGSSC